jgi:hypothetical protein
MKSENLRMILEALEQISTEYFFLMVLYILEDFVTAMTFYIILMIFAYKCFSLFAAHLTAKRMGDRLGFFWPYSKDEKKQIYEVFKRGLAHSPEYAGPVEHRELEGDGSVQDGRARRDYQPR